MTNNLVAKHARKFNKTNIMEDRKKKLKKGYTKHKGAQLPCSLLESVCFF